MELSNQQIKLISSQILLSDIKEYINNHIIEYEKFLKNQEKYKD